MSKEFRTCSKWSVTETGHPPPGPQLVLQAPRRPCPAGMPAAQLLRLRKEGEWPHNSSNAQRNTSVERAKADIFPQAKPSASAREVLVMWETRSLLFLEGWQVGSHTRGGTRDLCSYGPQCHWRAPQSLEREENRRKKNRKKRGNLIEKDLFIKKLWIELHPSNLASVMASQPAMHLEGNMSLI